MISHPNEDNTSRHILCSWVFVCVHIFLSTKLAPNPISSVHASLEEKGEGEVGGIGGGGGG